MLTEQRYEQILKLLEKEGSITVTEVKELLDTSESTAHLNTRRAVFFCFYLKSGH